jgi:hypothetical protein
MFDASYFNHKLKRDVEATSGAPIVELLLVGGHVHRIRAVIDTTDDWVTLEAYQMKGDLAHQRPRFGESSSAPYETFRVVVAYENIASIVLDPSPAESRTRPGFA